MEDVEQVNIEPDYDSFNEEFISMEELTPYDIDSLMNSFIEFY